MMSGSAGCGSDLLLPDPPGGGENVELSKVDGDGQTGMVGENLLKPLIVRVLTQRQAPARGRQVQFVFTTDAGEVTPATATTNDQGEAPVRWTLGTAPGSHTVTAQLVNGESEGEGEPQTELFTAEARPAAPDTLTAMSSISQPGRRGREVDTPPAVRVVDRFGNAVPDVPVAWQVIAGEGALTESLTRTGSDGTVSVRWTLGNRIGVHKLTAHIGQVTGSPVSFTATVLF